MHECDFVNRQELQTQLLQFHFSLQPTLQLDSKDSSKRGSSSKPKVKFWPLFGDFHCFFLLRVVKFTHWLICLGWIERSQVREDGRINGEENGKWERRQVVAGGSINTLPRMAHFSPSMPSPNTATLVNTKEQPCNCLGATSDAVKRAHQLAYQLA